MSDILSDFLTAHPIISWLVIGTAVIIVLVGVVLFIAWWFMHNLVGERVGVAYSTPDEFGLSFEEFSVMTRDDKRIDGWYIPRENAPATVLMLSGDQGRRSALLGHAKLFYDEGYSCALFDYRHHGTSDDDAITYGAREKYDAIAVLKYLRQNDLIAGKSIVFGFSMGASTALISAPELEGVDGYILNSPYAEFDIAFKDGINNMGLPKFPIYMIGRLMFRLVTGVDLKSIRPIDNAAKLDAPLLLLYAGQDRVTRPVNSEMIFDAALEPKEAVFFPNDEHIIVEDELDEITNEKYREAVLSFITEVCRNE